ncbi:phage protein [Clostridium tetani]|nr:DnaD domain protein [Clostridium tetani]AVP54501.1 DnaD domain protein [Clostridium tetani]RXI68569.1 DnaD domain protein [Clostridium tetani]RXI75232.1 DnaD domain protein [Clostridium tetani]WFN62894.1 DnaD domain protein [Clostridium tetani]SUY55101.1 phage protein [Clostridium tetani]
MAEGKEKGWISLYRDIQEHWIWEDAEKLKAWLDLLLLANHQSRKILLGNEVIEIKRGSTHTSELKLMDRWNWSKKKVRNFLQLLEKDNMIICEKSKKGTTITIINYEVYQGSRNHRETIKEPQGNHKETIKELLGDHKGYTNNNDNNYNNINNDNNSSGSTPNYIEFFNSNFHLINSYEINILNSFVKDGLSEEVILLALKKAVENNVRTIKYVKSILQSWLENNIKTVEEAEAREKEFKREKEEKKTKYSNVERKDNGAKIDSFNGYQQRTYDGSDGGMTFDDLEKKLLGWK